MRRCGERAGWVLSVVVLPEPPARAVVALVRQHPGVREPLPQRGQLRCVRRGVEVAHDHAGLHRPGVQLGQSGHLGGTVALCGSGA